MSVQDELEQAHARIHEMEHLFRFKSWRQTEKRAELTFLQKGIDLLLRFTSEASYGQDWNEFEAWKSEYDRMYPDGMPYNDGTIAPWYTEPELFDNDQELILCEDLEVLREAT